VSRKAWTSLALHAALLAGAVVTLAPLLWMLSASFMTTGEANAAPPPLLPARATLAQYRELFVRLDLGRSFVNSTALALCAALLSVVVNAAAGYAFAKLRFPGRGRLFAGLLAAMVIPGQVAMLPVFLLLRSMGLVNSFAGVILPGIASIFGIFLVRQFASSVPDELLDAARIDGAGELRIFRSIVLPLCRPILVTLGVLTFLGTWNDFMWPLIVLTDDTKWTLTVSLASLAGEHVQDTELMMAGAVVTVLPALLLFLFLQRSYIDGITAGSIKE
jgi:multiple sugar transport system permease protein